MATPILFIYAIGITVFILALDEENPKSKNMYSILYLGLSFFINLMGYLLSYSDNDYLSLAYLPMALMSISIILLIYRAWSLLSVGENWDSMADED